MNTHEVAYAARIPYAQVDRWTRAGFIKAARVRRGKSTDAIGPLGPTGSGVNRDYPEVEAKVAAVMHDLIATSHMAPAKAALVARELVVTGRTELTGNLVLIQVVKTW